jgi:hypothetical protein
VTNKPPAGLTVADYDSIEAAVMETARGRWFLLEHDRRRREAETTQFADAIARLERAIGAGGQPALEPAKQIASARPVAPMPKAAAIGERLQDIAWNMRERGFDDAICGAIEEQARLVRGLAEGAPPLPASLSTPAAPQTPPAGVTTSPRALTWTPSPAAVANPPKDGRLEALARIDAMPLAEKLALFM